MTGAVALPSHAHVPGRNARHPEGAFSTLRASVTPGLCASDLARTEAFRAGLAFLDAGYFWEAHEVFEPVWMAAPSASRERALVQALIQLANAELKAVMGMPRAVLRLCGMVEGHLAVAGQGGQREILGLDLAGLHDRVAVLRGRIEG